PPRERGHANSMPLAAALRKQDASGEPLRRPPARLKIPAIAPAPRPLRARPEFLDERSTRKAALEQPIGGRGDPLDRAFGDNSRGATERQDRGGRGRQATALLREPAPCGRHPASRAVPL